MCTERYSWKKLFIVINIVYLIRSGRVSKVSNETISPTLIQVSSPLGLSSKICTMSAGMLACVCLPDIISVTLYGAIITAIISDSPVTHVVSDLLRGKLIYLYTERNLHSL